MLDRRLGQLLLVPITAISVGGFLLGGDLTVKAYLDRTTVAVGEGFTLSVQVNGAWSSQMEDPELPPMEDFAEPRGSGSSQQIQYVNGSLSVSRTVNFSFLATQAGDFTIQPVKVRVAGKVYHTDPIQMRIRRQSAVAPPVSGGKKDSVVPGIPHEDLFLRAVANKHQVYQNEAVIVRYTLYTRLNVASYSLSKLPGTAGFWVEDYPLPQQPVTRTEIINGKRYTVATLKKMALFATTPGSKRIDPLALELQIRGRRRFSSFFDDFFSRSSPFGGVTTRLVQSNPISLEVLPLPQDQKPATFKGAVGRFAVESEVDKTQVKTNEAVTLKIRVSGAGNLPALTEPLLPVPPSFEKYPPKVDAKTRTSEEGVSGEKTYEYVLIPRAPGTQEIPPVEIAYFDPKSKTYGVSRSDPILINVAKGKETGSAAQAGLSKQELKLIGQDIRFIKTRTGSLRRKGASLIGTRTLWLSAVIPLLCLAGALVYRQRRDRAASDLAYARDRRARRLAKKRFSQARSRMEPSTRKEFFAEVGKALQGFLGDKLNIAEAGMISQEVRSGLLERGVPEEPVKRYFECLEICDLKRFSPSDASVVEMREFLKEAEAAMVQLGHALSRPKNLRKEKEA
ncbi:MAG: BatD family protein [Acidobacteriota bacterium]